MKVILLKDVRDQGKKGDLIDAADGFARNYLLPRKLAMLATADAINSKKLSDEAALRHIDLAKQAAKELAVRLGTLKVLVHAKAGTGGRLFGSVTTKEISEELLSQHHIDIQKAKMMLDEPIKTFGTFTVKVKIYADVSATVTVQVTELASAEK